MCMLGVSSYFYKDISHIRLGPHPNDLINHLFKDHISKCSHMGVRTLTYGFGGDMVQPTADTMGF